MDDEVKELLLVAMRELRNGNLGEALLILERVVDPKFTCSEHANGAYLMFNGDEPKSGLRDYFGMALGQQIAGHISTDNDIGKLKDNHPLIVKVGH